jgi:hypothetical protein
VTGPSQGLYLYRTAQSTETRTYVLASSGIPTQDPSVREVQDIQVLSSENTGCNRIRHTHLKIYCDQTNSNITTQFVTEHLLKLQVFYKCSIRLPRVMRQTSRRYYNSSHSLFKKVTSTRAMALTILSRSS